MRGTWHLKQPLRFPAMVTIGVWGSVMVPNKVELAFEPWSRIPSWHTDNSRIWDGVDVFSVSKHGTILRISPSSLQTIRLPSQLWILLEARLTAERLPQEHSVEGRRLSARLASPAKSTLRRVAGTLKHIISSRFASTTRGTHARASLNPSQTVRMPE